MTGQNHIGSSAELFAELTASNLERKPNESELMQAPGAPVEAVLDLETEMMQWPKAPVEANLDLDTEMQGPKALLEAVLDLELKLIVEQGVQNVFRCRSGSGFSFLLPLCTG